MFAPMQSSASAPQSLSPNVPVLGLVSLLMGMSSAMIYGVLPVFLVVVLGASTASVGFIEGIAEATTSFAKIFSGITSDRIRRRKPLVSRTAIAITACAASIARTRKERNNVGATSVRLVSSRCGMASI